MLYNITHTFEEQQKANEVFFSVEAASRSLNTFLNTIERGNEYETNYGKEVLNTILPLIKTYIEEMVEKRGQHHNKFWYEELRPFIQASKGSKRGMSDFVSEMVALNLVATFSKKKTLTSLVRSMSDACMNLLDIEYSAREELSLQAMKFFVGVVLNIREVCDVFTIFRDEEKSDYTVQGSFHWSTVIQKEMDTLKVSTFSCAPMVCKPNDHFDLLSSEGGYLTLKSPLLKRPTRINGQVHKAITSFTNKTNPDFFKMVNDIQNTPYQVNNKLLTIINSYYDKGYFFNDFPSDFSQVEEDCLKEANDIISKAAEKWESVSKNFIRKETNKAKANGKEKVRKTNDILEQAALFSDYEFIYFPIYFDDRGRRYTYTPTSSLTYMGTELAKALLLFGNKQAFNEDGISALFQTLGNTLGKDKTTLSNKEAYARKWYEDNKATFYAGDFEMFFTQPFEEPINAMAIILELMEWEKDPSYESGYIAHRDARCSGASIIGTMLQDKQAMSLTSVLDVVDGINLPDAYTYVANQAHKLNTDTYFEENADILFSRKVWKTPTMTRAAYASTRHTIHLRNREEFAKAGLDFDKVNDFTNLMMKALDTSLPSCSKYLDAIQKATKEHVKETGCYCFKAPLTGFPMVRRKNKSVEKLLESPGTFQRIRLVIKTYTDNLDVQKMVQAIGPDLIHSTDASLLFKVQELCPDFYIATVHDSIGAHPNNVKRVVSAYAEAMYELATSGVADKLFKQVGGVAPYISNLTKEELESIKTSKHVLV